MIIGYVDIEDKSIETHRDSYLLHTLSVVSVRRPFLAPGAILGAGFAGFTAAFMDLLFLEEIVSTLALSILAPLLAAQAGQLKLLSRDLRGSELSGVIWGRYAELNRKRHDIIHAMRHVKAESKS